MKKLLTLLIAGAMTLSLTACGGVDTTKFEESYAKAETAFNDLGDYMDENKAYIAPEAFTTVNQIGDKLEEHYTLIMENEDVTQEQADVAIEWVDTIPDAMAEMKAGLEVEIAQIKENATEPDPVGELKPFSQEDIATLQAAYDELSALNSNFVDAYDFLTEEEQAVVADVIGTVLTDLEAVLFSEEAIGSADTQGYIANVLNVLEASKAAWAETEARLLGGDSEVG